MSLFIPSDGGGGGGEVAGQCSEKNVFPLKMRDLAARPIYTEDEGGGEDGVNAQ